MERRAIDLLEGLSFDNKIHDGRFFTATLNSSALGASSWLDLELITSTTMDAHIFWDLNNSGGTAEVIFCDLSTSSTYTHGATSVSAINHNLASTFVSTMSVFTGGTNTAFLTSTMTSTQALLKANYYIGSTGTAASRGESGARSEYNEFLLASGSTYVLRIWNRSAAGYGTLNLFWYEG